MNIFRILGIILVVVGVVLLAMGLSSTDAISDKVAVVATGRHTKTTIWYIITGLIMLVGGGALWLRGRPKL